VKDREKDCCVTWVCRGWLNTCPCVSVACSSHIVLTSGRAWCMAERTSAVRYVTWLAAVTC